ncbi:MAG: hypothetical protein HWQ38_32105 [Nostoc sp. NMS7]|uniref:hypothetical protein n=1 Tax=Nostoc sp. NMS7 TaxID=2815391 RepID=UPI0025D7CBBA|nr:hypothetical protein [Nostoc sp. NMS7]MBN3950866.1 hypothetical protein [Nostoc sp. NMS7]
MSLVTCTERTRTASRREAVGVVTEPCRSAASRREVLVISHWALIISPISPISPLLKDFGGETRRE